MTTDNPNEDPNIRGDAFKTLIVARLSYEATEEDLEREFARFGSIERVRPDGPPSNRFRHQRLTSENRFGSSKTPTLMRRATRNVNPTEVMHSWFSSAKRT